MKLFFAPRTISIAIAAALHEAGLKHELVQLDFASGEQTKPAYHAINPKGRVPALLVDGDILTETGAILEWIAVQVPARGWVPEDAIQAARMRAVMYYLASTMHVNHAHKMRGHRWADNDEARAEMTAKVPQTMTESARFIEENALAGPFVLGDVLCIADFYLYTVCSWLEGDGVDVSAFPRILSFREAMEALPSILHAHDNGWY